MVLVPSHFIKELQLSSRSRIPESLRVALNKIKQQHYEELYEPEADRKTSLQDALKEVLEVFCSSNQTLCHLRYVWMALVLTLAVKPTVEYYQPSNLFPKNTIRLIVLWLIKSINKSSKYELNKLVNIFLESQDFTYYQTMLLVVLGFTRNTHNCAILS